MTESSQYNSGWTVLDNGKQFGPHTIEEITSFLAAGGLSPNAQVWREGMSDWLPVTKIVAVPGGTPATPPTIQALPYSSTPSAKRATRRTYRQRVGRRSFIFQIWLAIWTVSYIAWIVSMMASVGAHTSAAVPPAPSPGFSYSPPPAYTPPNPVTSTLTADLMSGLTSSWICLIVGWGIVGLPVGIAAVATLEQNK